jgi:hypothetical protein
VASELSQVVVTGPEAGAWEQGGPTVDGATVTQPLRPLEPSGVYEVTWRVVADDGHPISGTFAFTYAGTPTPTTSTSDVDASAPDASPVATASSDVLPIAGSAESGPSGLLLTGVLLAGTLALAGSAVLLSGRRRPGSSGQDDEEHVQHG